MRKAEEVFIIVRELSRNSVHGRYFSWRQWFRACVAVMNPQKHQLKSGFKCTVGNMLRAQCKNGTVMRLERGLYKFIELEPKSPLYVVPRNHMKHGAETKMLRKSRKRLPLS